MAAYYNEHDPAAARWLRELMHEGLIARGDVDERSIRDVRASDLRGYAQHHFFAGIGVWSHALRGAGWPDDRPVWTGSCPCQPFSAAGKGLGFADDRHLWPEFLRLIAECRPGVVFGEQVASAGAWIDLVSSDLEDRGYAFAATDLPAAGFDGAHIRQRFYWVADADNTEWWSERAPRNDGDWTPTGRVQGDGHVGDGGAHGGMADASGQRRDGRQDTAWANRGSFAEDGRPADGMADAAGWAAGAERQQHGGQHGQLAADGGAGLWLGNTSVSGSQGWRVQSEGGNQRPLGATGVDGGRCGASDSIGRAADWLFCSDGLWRPVESGTFPLAPTSPGRVGRLRGYGNALDAVAAREFIAAYLDCAPAERVMA